MESRRTSTTFGDTIMVEAGGGLSKPFKFPKHQKSEGDDIDSVTDMSTGASSDDSNFAEYALSAVRHTVVRKIKRSAKGLAQKSGDKLRPVLRKVRIPSGPSHRRQAVRKPTEKQERNRKRRGAAIAKLKRMYHRVNQDPFVTSRAGLAIAGLFLVLRAGDRLLAACWALVSMVILHETTYLASTKALGEWYFLNAITLVISVGSFCIWTLFGHISVVKADWTTLSISDKLWFWGRALPRLWGATLLYLLYKDVIQTRSTNQADDDIVDCWSIRVSLLQARNTGYSHVPGQTTMDRKTLRNSKLVLSHGAVQIGSADGKPLIINNTEDVRGVPTTALRFETLAFSHYLERQPTIECQIASNTKGGTVGTATIPIPENAELRILSWYPVRNKLGNQIGELFIEIQKVQSPEQFLVRISTFIPILAFALTLFYWK